MDKPERQWTWCFYCARDKLTAKKRRGFARTICDECVEVRKPKK